MNKPPAKKPVYTTNAYAFTHPYSIGAVAALSGHQPPPVVRSVVEWGCGTGWNLIALAARLPEASFVGVDLDGTAIGVGRERIKKLGLKNIELLTARFEHSETAPADYQIVHGLYSWIGKRSQEHLLARLLYGAKPDGLIFLSYNTLPGWALGDVLRPVIRNGPLDAMTLITLLAHSRTIQPTPDQAALTAKFAAVAAAVEKQPDYLDHEWLEPQAAGSWHKDVISVAKAYKLIYCGDTDLTVWGTNGLTPEAAMVIEQFKADPAIFGTLRDILTMETFRRSVFCYEPKAASEGVPALCVFHSLTRQDGFWQHADGRTLTVPPGSQLDALLTAMTAFPGGQYVTVLADQASLPLDVACAVLPLLALKGLVTFRSAPLFTPPDVERPVCDPFVRQCIENNFPLVSKAHVQAELHPTVVDFLSKLDGQRVSGEDQALVATLGRTGFLI